MNEVSPYSVGDYVKIDERFYARVARIHDYPDENPRYYYDLEYKIEEWSKNGRRLFRSYGPYLWMDISIDRLEPINDEEKYKILVALGYIDEGDDISNLKYLVGDILL